MRQESRYVLVVDGYALCQDNNLEAIKALTGGLSGIVQIYDGGRMIYHSMQSKAGS